MLNIADKTFTSRLFLGTGKFASSALMAEAAKASGSQLVTVALKRVELSACTTDDMIAPLLHQGLQLLPNTSGARTAAEAILAAELSRESHARSHRDTKGCRRVSEARFCGLTLCAGRPRVV